MTGVEQPTERKCCACVTEPRWCPCDCCVHGPAGKMSSALDELERGDHADAGRDFGRGVAYAAKHIRAVLDGLV